MNNHPRLFAVLLSVIGFGGVLIAVYGFLNLNRLASVLPPNMAPRLAIWAVFGVLSLGTGVTMLKRGRLVRSVAISVAALLGALFACVLAFVPTEWTEFSYLPILALACVWPERRGAT
jgi:hypothetical protein